jgi:hypothetical protein
MNQQIKQRAYALLAVSTLATGILTATLVGGGAVAQAANRIAPWDAMKVATAKVGGKAIQATYVQEDGKFIYDVVIIKGQKLMEVGVDATTGKAGAVETVTPEDEGREFTADLHKALGHKVAPEAPEKGEAGEKND